MPYDKCLSFENIIGAFEFAQNQPWCNGHCIEWIGNAWKNTPPMDWLRASMEPGSPVFQRTIQRGKGFKFKAEHLSQAAKQRIQNYMSKCQLNDTIAWSFLGVPQHAFESKEKQVGTDLVSNTSLAKTISKFSNALIGWNYNTSQFNLLDPYYSAKHGELRGRQHQTAFVWSRNASDEFAHFFDPNVGHFMMKLIDFPEFFSDYLFDICEIENAKVSRSFDVVTITGLRR